MSQSKQPAWRLKRNLAHTRWRDLSLEVDVHQPTKGVLVNFPSHASAGRLLATPQVLVQPQEKLDPYTRAGHLITAYPCTEHRIFGGELSYRVSEFPVDNFADDDGEDAEEGELLDSIHENSAPEPPSSQSLTIELIYSIQTDLLDTQPRPTIVSKVAGNSLEMFRCVGGEFQPTASSDGALACLIGDGQQLTLVTVMPSDGGFCSVNQSELVPGRSEFEVSWELVSEFLEKGVIRRFRAFSAVGTDRESLFAAAQFFYHSEIPLTA